MVLSSQGFFPSKIGGGGGGGGGGGEVTIIIIWIPRLPVL